MSTIKGPERLVIMLDDAERAIIGSADDHGENFDVGLTYPVAFGHLNYTGQEAHLDGVNTLHFYEFGKSTDYSFVRKQIALMSESYGFAIRYRGETFRKEAAPDEAEHPLDIEYNKLEAFAAALGKSGSSAAHTAAIFRTLARVINTPYPDPVDLNWTEPEPEKEIERPRQSNGRLLRKIRM